MKNPPSRPIWPLVLGIAGPVIWAGSAFLSEPTSAVIGAGGALVGIVGAIWAHLTVSTFERTFGESDWSPAGDEFVLTINAKQHRRGNRPIVQLNGLREGGGYEEVLADNRTLADGSVELAASRPFAGRVLIQ